MKKIEGAVPTVGRINEPVQDMLDKPHHLRMDIYDHSR